MSDLSFADLKAQVGRKLRILADSETLSAEDGDLIGKALLWVESYLNRLGKLSLDVANGIDRPFDGPVSMFAAAMLCDDFEVPEPYRSTLLRDGALDAPGRSLAERQLEALLEGVPVKRETVPNTTIY